MALPCSLDAGDVKSGRRRSSISGLQSSEIRPVDRSALNLLQRELGNQYETLRAELRQVRDSHEKAISRAQEELAQTFQKELLKSMEDLKALTQQGGQQLQQVTVCIGPNGQQQTESLNPPKMNAVELLKLEDPSKREEQGNDAPQQPAQKFSGSPRAQEIASKDKARGARFTKFQPAFQGQEEEEEEKTPQDAGDARPEGEFAGRPNQWAFLQAKQWDSPAALDPEEKHGIYEYPITVPDRTLWRKMKTVILSNNFDLVIGFVILANSVVMGIQLEYEGHLAAESIGLQPDKEDGWPGAEGAFKILDHIFALIFLGEFISRFAAMRCAYFKSAFNWMDAGIVAASVLELYIVPLIGLMFPDMSFLRLLRVLKIIRVLRILRVLKAFDKLRQLLNAVLCSLSALFWSINLIAMIILVFSIFMSLSLSDWLQDESVDPAKREQVYNYFGSFSRSIITLFEITLAVGTWGRVGRVIIFDVSRNYFIFFVFYMAMISFAMMKVISAIFLKETLAAAAEDADEQMSLKNRDPEYVKKLVSVFNEIDTGKGGVLTLDELTHACKDEDLIRKLKSIGIEASEVVGLFILMDDGDNEISFAEFLSGTMRLKNMRKGVDLPTILYENKKLLSQLLGIGSRLDRLSEYLGDNRAPPEDLG